VEARVPGVCCSCGLEKERHASGATVKRYWWQCPVATLSWFVASLAQGVEWREKKKRKEKGEKRKERERKKEREKKKEKNREKRKMNYLTF
jgi:hypothetical protein